MRLVVTGGAGFIGSCLVINAIRQGHDVLTIDKLTYAGRRTALTDVIGSSRHRFLEADIVNASEMNDAISSFAPDAIFHLAAESHVDRSIDGPGQFVETNVRGTFVLLEAALKYWTATSGSQRDQFRFVHVSTDEVFGALSGDGAFTAQTRYAPNSPYAASKAAADHFARAWQATYGLPVIVTNCSNNYGPRQHSEKLIPTVIRHALEGQPIPVYGTGENVRDWLYVEDHASGLMAALSNGKPGETYLFGGECELRNIDLVNLICKALDNRKPSAAGHSYTRQISFVTDRPGHDFRYAVDCSSAKSRLGWRAAEQMETGLIKTIDWYLSNMDWLASTVELSRLGTRYDKFDGGAC